MISIRHPNKKWVNMKHLFVVWNSVRNWVMFISMSLFIRQCQFMVGGQLVLEGATYLALMLVTNANVFPGIIITGSWDKTVRTWDPRQPQPTGTYSQPDKVNNCSSFKNKDE